MNVIGPFPLYAKLNPIYSQILHVRSIWNSFKIFTVSLSAEEFVNGTLNLTYLNFRLCRSNRSAFHDILIYSPTISHDRHLSVRGWHMSSEWEGSGAHSSKFFGRTVFHRGYKYPSPSSLLFYFARPLSSSSFSNPSATATSSSPVRKSFTASTSSPSYSRRPRISSLRRRRSCLPQPS